MLFNNNVFNQIILGYFMKFCITLYDFMLIRTIMKLIVFLCHVL